MRDLSTWLAGLSAVAAWLAVLYAYRTARVAQSQLRLEEGREGRQTPQLTVQITDSFSQRLGESSTRLYAFSLLITNPSDAPNSITGVDLLVDYELESGELLSIVARQHLDEQAESSAAELRPPLALAQRDAVVGWVFFRLDARIPRDYRVRNYSVTVRDAFGGTFDARAIIVREVIDVVAEE